MPADLVLSGVAVAAPGLQDVTDVLHGAAGTAADYDPAALLGTRGLRYKDEATRLGLLAADRALRDARLLDDGALQVDGGTFGVVVSSNLGNLDTVCRVVDVIERETVTGTSPMDLPNASSNIIASSIAIRYGLRGPNLTVCNGETSGLDAVQWARMLLAAGRADRMLVVGVEVSNAVVTALRAGSARPAFHGATAVVVESAAQVRCRGGPERARIAGYARRAGVAESFAALRTADPVGLWLVPEGERTGSVPAGAVADLTARHGRASGALGVLQCAAAIGWFAAGNTAAVLATAGGPGADATAATLLRAGGDAR